MPQIKKIDLLIEAETTNKDMIKHIENVSSYNKSKPYTKINYQNILPAMTCEIELVRKFRKLAKEKQWSHTTLMNNILRDFFKKDGD